MVLFMICFLSLVALVVIGISAMGIYLFVSSSFQKYAPSVRTSGRLKKILLDEVSQYLETTPIGQQIVDLGSGWGTLLIPLAKKFPQHQFIGLERAFTPFNVSRWRARKIENMCFLKEDFFEYDLRHTDVVVMFLIGFMMPKVTEKCLEELPKGAKVFVVRFPFVNVAPSNILDLGNKMEKLYVYEIH